MTMAECQVWLHRADCSPLVLPPLEWLQERAQQREDARHPRRTASARQPPNQATAPIQQPQYAIADADPHADGRPLAYVGPERYRQYSSTGLAKRVQGGAFSNTTRAIAVGVLVLTCSRVGALFCG